MLLFIHCCWWRNNAKLISGWKARQANLFTKCCIAEICHISEIIQIKFCHLHSIVDIQSGPIIPQIVNLRFRLSCGGMMDPRLLDLFFKCLGIGLQIPITRCKRSWQEIRIQMKWRQIAFTHWKPGDITAKGIRNALTRDAPQRNILEPKAKWRSSFSKTWKKMNKTDLF